jgi:DNA-binding transcriptional LysR family regulator
MENIDFNLLTALDALLTDCSVTAAARRLGLSASAMSRTLSRLRIATDDPLLVRDAREVLSPQAGDLDIVGLERTFTIRASEGFVGLFAAPLVTAIADVAPHVRLRFAPKANKDARPLREGEIDLEIGVLGVSAPEVRVQLIFRDQFIGAVRVGHPLLTGPMSPERYASCKHVVASRRGAFKGPVDDALEEVGLRRDVVAVVPGFPDAIRIARQSDLVALVPRSCFRSVDAVTESIATFELPVPTPEIVVAAMWHPRMDADPAHRWLRDQVMAVCRAIPQQQ